MLFSSGMRKTKGKKHKKQFIKFQKLTYQDPRHAKCCNFWHMRE